MDGQQIIIEIDRRVSSEEHKDYQYWTIGVTNDPERRKEEHRNAGKRIYWWTHWRANSEAEARKLEQYFLDKGMKGDTGGGNPRDKPDNVYIF